MATRVAPLFVSRKTAAAMCEFGVNTIDKAIHTGQLPAKKVGGVIGPDGERIRFRYRIDVHDLEAWFASLPEV